MAPLLVLAWVFFIWSEATVFPYLATTPPARFSFETLEECRDVRDIMLLLTGPTERVSGCDET